MTLSRDEILNASDLETKLVDVPEWKGSVLVRGLSGEERDAFEASLNDRRPALFGPNKGQMENVPNLTNARAKLVARSIVDEAGERVFTDADIVALGKKSALALTRVYEAAAELSGMTDTAAEEAEGNSEAVPSDGSTSTSLENLDAPSPNSSPESPVES